MTRVTGVFGWPVGHSRSPVFQNAAFRSLGLDFIYVPFAVRPEHLATAVSGIRALGLAGVNLTIPHKESVAALLDEVDEEAAQVGSVNTVWNADGKLCGTTTDGRGFVRSLREDGGFDVCGKTVLVLGAGGAARSICGALIRAGAGRLFVWNRTAARAECLVEHLRSVLGCSDARCVDGARLHDAAFMKDLDLVVNATSVGMREGDAAFLRGELLHPDLFVYDIVYSRTTALLEAARRAGCRWLDGSSMLVYQGAISFEIWTGRAAPIDVMKRALAGAADLERGG